MNTKRMQTPKYMEGTSGREEQALLLKAVVSKVWQWPTESSETQFGTKSIDRTIIIDERVQGLSASSAAKYQGQFEF